MKNALLTILFAVGAMAYSFGQYPTVRVHIKNLTFDDLGVAMSTAVGSPNVCPTVFSSTPTHFVPALAPDHIFILGVVPDPALVVRPHTVGCFHFTDLTIPSSWQISTCWNPACVSSSEPFYDIQITACGDYDTYITIDYM